MSVPAIERRLGGRSHRGRDRLAGEEEAARLRVDANRIRRQRHFLG